MKIIVNATEHIVTTKCLTSVLTEIGYADGVFATAVNGQFVPQAAREGYTLHPFDRIEILSPVQGG